MTDNFTHIFTVDHREGGGKTVDKAYNLDKKPLGEGSYGTVYKGAHKETGDVRAIKSIDIKKVSDPKRFQQEVEIQSKLDHPHIVKLYEIFQDDKRYFLVMEMCTGGELFDRIIEETEKHEGKAFEENDAALIMCQIMGAMQYLHDQRFCHRDIKPENFLLADKNKKEIDIKVIDFGLAKTFVPGESELLTKAGTPYYVAPQVLLSKKGQGYNELCDIWSCGVLTYIIICGYPPFYGDKDSDILKMVKKGKFDFPDEDWKSVSKEGKDIISKMLTFDVAKRPSAEELMKHPWMSKATAPKSGVALGKDLGSRLKKFTEIPKFKKLAITVIAKNIKTDDIQEMKQAFLKFDKDHSGTLTKEELVAGMKAANVDLPPDLLSEMDKLDTDGSGSIDYTEFIAATLSMQQQIKDEHLVCAFRVLDVDNSGTLSRSELKQYFAESEVEQIFKDVDLNGDGNISMEEFKNYMNKS